MVLGTGMHACTRGLVPSMVDHRGGGGIDKSNATARTLDGNSTGNGAGFHRFQKVWLPIIFDDLSPPRESLSSTLREWISSSLNPVIGVVNQRARTRFAGRFARVRATLYLLENKGGLVAG